MLDLKTTRQILAQAAAVSVLCAHTSAAQVEPPVCAAAARAATTQTLRSAEIAQLAECPTSGPNALGTTWQHAGSLAGPELAALIGSSRRTRDGRVYAAAAAAAADRTRPNELRLASLSVLSAYYRADLAPSLGWLQSARIGDPIPVSTDAYDGTGVVPLPANRLVEFPRLLYRLAQGDRDSSIAQAALRLRQYLALSDPEHTPVSPNAVRLVAGCRNLLSLESTLDVTIPIRVRVLGTTTEHTYTLNRWVGGPPIKLTLDLPPGAVIASVGDGHELARLADRKGSCAER